MRRAAVYAVLVILPSTSLAWLGFKNLENARTERLRAQRVQAISSLEAICSDLARQVELRLARERERPFYEYEEYYRPRDSISSVANYVVNPLTTVADPMIRARWQTPRAPELKEIPSESISILPTDLGCRQQVEASWMATINAEATKDLEANKNNLTTCVMMPNEVVAANRMQHQLREHVERAQSGAREDNAYLGVADQAWRNNVRTNSPNIVATYHTDLGLRLFASADDIELLSLREVTLPAIDATSATDALEASRVLQGVTFDLKRLFEESVRSLLPYLAAEGVTIQLAATESNAAPELTRPLDQLFGASAVSGLASIFAELDPAAIEAGVATQRQDLRWLLTALGAAIVITSFLAYRALRREWQLLEQQRAFVSAVTHELRTPVAGIRLYADLLQEGWVANEGERKSFFGTLRGEADRLEKLVDDVLHVAAFDRDEPRVRPELHELALAEVVTQIAEEFRRAPRERTFELVCQELAPGSARIDRESLRRILFNLFENAVKYTPSERQPHVAVSVHAFGSELVIEVVDNACGLPDQERKHIFDDFYRVGEESRRTARGAGLGLGVVRRHVEALGGRISVESELGTGSIFRVGLPRTA